MFSHRKVTSYKLQVTSFVASCFLLLASCNILNPADPVPAYIKVDSFTINTDLATQGSNSSNISDVWVSIDGQALGAYELPATFPVLFTGSHHVKLSAGILLSGISSTREAYPFYITFDTAVTLEAGKVIPVMPWSTYTSNTQFEPSPVGEDFDHSFITLKRTSTSDTTINIVSDANCFEGKSGAVFLDAARPEFECESIDSFSLSGGGSPCFVELNYKCNVEFTVGTIANTSSTVYKNDVVIVRATDVWKKMYVNLTPTVSSITDAIAWKIYIYAKKEDTQSTATLYFDNIKVVH